MVSETPYTPNKDFVKPMKQKGLLQLYSNIKTRKHFVHNYKFQKVLKLLYVDRLSMPLNGDFEEYSTYT